MDTASKCPGVIDQGLHKHHRGSEMNRSAAQGAGQIIGLIDGRPQLLIGQLVAVAVTWLLAGVATFVILKILDVTMGLRPKRDEELQGLDLSQHGEEGYIFI